VNANGTRPLRYRRPVSAFWWLQRRAYVAFVLRELSSLFVAWFVVLLLLLVNAVTAGQAQYRQFLDWTANPWIVLLNVIALLFVVLHAITWFHLTPQAMVVRLRGRRVPRKWVLGSLYLAWIAVSAVAAWVVLGG
jgi:fumarate reductase subunit C